MTTFRERQAATRERNVRWHRDHPRSDLVLQWVFEFDVVLFFLLAVLHAARLEWSAFYFGAQALLFGLFGWRWREDRKRAEQARGRVDLPRRGSAAAAQSVGRRRLVIALVGAGTLFVAISAIAVAAGGGSNASMATFLSGSGLCASGYSLRR